MPFQMEDVLLQLKELKRNDRVMPVHRNILVSSVLPWLSIAHLFHTGNHKLNISSIHMGIKRKSHA
jgi:hypothetical protein